MELIIIQCKVFFIKTFVEVIINLKHTKNYTNITFYITSSAKIQICTFVERLILVLWENSTLFTLNHKLDIC